MKMHFCIPVSQQRPDALGGRYVLYSVYLDGFLFCRVRYSQLHRWNEQLRRVFGSCLPPFPPKYYLAMTTSMADERRDQLEQYLQNVPMDPNVLRSDVFIDFLKLLQLDTFNIATKKSSLDVYLPDGRSVKIEILTSDTAERVLEVVSHRIGLCQELLGYFSLFLIQFHKEDKLSVVKKWRTLNFHMLVFKVQKWKTVRLDSESGKYMDPSLDARLMDCRVAGELIYLQAIQDIEKEWAKPTPAQREKLEALQKEDNQAKEGILIPWCQGQAYPMESFPMLPWRLLTWQHGKFLALSREVRHYGYMQLDPCTCDYPEPGCEAIVSVGSDQISCCVTLPDGKTQDVVFQMGSVKCWQVTFLGTLLDMDGPLRTLNQDLELRFQYSEDSRWQWFVIHTKQAFLLSNCLKKMITEKMVKKAAENPEMIEVPERGKSKRNRIQQNQEKDCPSFLPRRSKISIKVAEDDCVFGTIKEEDL